LKHKLLSVSLVSLVILVVFVAMVSFELLRNKDPYPSGLFFGVTADGNITATKTLIDRVKGITNLLIINNPDVIRNETSLNEVCHYAYEAGQSFLFLWLTRLIGSITMTRLNGFQNQKKSMETVFWGFIFMMNKVEIN
jgi:hypothetical protein